jgi:uncharacterized protein (TIGR02246 family)
MADPRTAKIDFMIAESGIRQLYGRYADAVWRKDVPAFVECFAEDAIWKIGGRTLHGREEIGGVFEASLAPSERVMMWLGIPVITLTGERTATGRVQVTELIKRKDGSSARTLALYYERYVEEDGVWRLGWHHFNLYYFGPPDLSATFLENMEYGPPPGLPGADDPTTVRR